MGLALNEFGSGASSDSLVIYTNASSAPSTPANTAYPGINQWTPPSGWTKQPTNTTVGQTVYVSYGTLITNNTFIQWSAPLPAPVYGVRSLNGLVGSLVISGTNGLQAYTDGTTTVVVDGATLQNAINTINTTLGTKLGVIVATTTPPATVSNNIYIQTNVAGSSIVSIFYPVNNAWVSYAQTNTTINGLSGAVVLGGTGIVSVSNNGQNISINANAVTSINSQSGAVTLTGTGITVSNSGPTFTFALDSNWLNNSVSTTVSGIDTLTKSGIYNYSNNSIGYSLVNSINSTNSGFQIRVGSDLTFNYRVKANGTWGNWQGLIQDIYSEVKSILLAGSNVTITPDDVNETLTISASGGGGGSSVTADVNWGSGGKSKDQYTAPSTVNNQSIVLSLTSAYTPTITSVSVGGVSLTSPFTITGTLPNFTCTIPTGQIVGSVQLNGGAVVISGSANSVSYSTVAGTLTTNPPIPFGSVVSGVYIMQTVPFWSKLSTINITGSITGTTTNIALSIASNSVTSFGVTSFSIDPTVQQSITGSVTGNGLKGAGSSSVNISQSVSTIPIYKPLFVKITANASNPAFTTTDTNSQSNAQVGSTITSATPQASSNYVWIATPTSIALNQIYFHSLVDIPFTPNVSFTTNINIGGEPYNVYGATNLNGQVTFIIK